ncbi:NTF2-like protein, partial [Aureobasidium melanogenum]
MASESAMNGTFVPQNGYGSIDQSGYTAPSYPSSAPSQSNNSAADIPKDEVGWYFVEQYYTTLSRSPEKVYLFYNKRSQFVSGNETEKVEVCVGQRAINERIKELDFSECKVRVTNVDSQASDDHIVIQVIGEISNKSAPHKKFTQTFVLAAQTNGYFVLNDIFRYIIEEEDEAEATEESAAIQEPAPTAVQEPEHETLTSSEDPVAIEKDAAKVDKE